MTVEDDLDDSAVPGIMNMVSIWLAEALAADAQTSDVRTYLCCTVPTKTGDQPGPVYVRTSVRTFVRASQAIRQDQRLVPLTRLL